MYENETEAEADQRVEEILILEAMYFDASDYPGVGNGEVTDDCALDGEI